MKILTVCGMGSGTSLILKMNVDSILRKMDIKANVKAADLGSIKGADADLIIGTRDFEKRFNNSEIPYILLDSVLDATELESKLKKYFNK